MIMRISGLVFRWTRVPISSTSTFSIKCTKCIHNRFNNNDFLTIVAFVAYVLISELESRYRNTSPDIRIIIIILIYILFISLIFSMHIDVNKKCMTSLDETESLYYSLIRESPFLEEISLPYLRQLINWAVITILFLIKIPSKDIFIYISMKRSSNLNRMDLINFWYQMIFRNGKTCLYYITSINNNKNKFSLY